jgi:PAS domain S-box-containing protein
MGQQPKATLRAATEDPDQPAAGGAASGREKSRLLEAFFDYSLDPLVTISPEGKITDANPATETATGVPSARLIGTNFSDYFVERERAEAGYQLVLRAGFVRDYPLTIRHLSGRTIDVLYNAVVYRNETGTVQGVFAAARDVTERSRAESELARYRDHLEELIRARTNELEAANARLQADITERQKREAELDRLNRTLKALSASSQAMMRATDESAYLNEVCQIIVRDCGHSMVWIGFVRDDPEKTVQRVAQAGFDEGYIESLQVTWADTERGRGPTGTAIRTGRPSGCRNMQTDSSFAPWRAEALRRGYLSSMVVPLMDGGRAFGTITIYSREPDPFTPEEVGLLSELAEDVGYGVSALRLRHANAQAEQALQTARAELEVRVGERTAQLRALAAELTQSEERERRRIGQILHDDLQQLLVAARLRLEAVRERKEAGAVSGDLLRIEGLISESNAVARGLSHELSPTVLHELGLAAGLRWLGRWMHEKHGLVVRVDANVSAESLEHDVKVLLFQSVRELLFNVIKHAGVKRASVRMSVGTDGQLEILVSDRGRGIDPAQAREGRIASMGFGLFGIRERLAFVGGKMEVESKPGGGARFRLVVPLPGESTVALAVVDRRINRGQAAPRREPAAPQSLQPTQAHSLPTIRVLLADDHKIVRDGLAAILHQRAGLEVVGMAADGQEAVTLAGVLLPHVVIMDVSMPRLDGMAATRQIVATWPQIKVIGLTMHADDVSLDAMRAAGAFDCLPKSGPTENLVSAIYAATHWPAPPSS